MNKIVRIVSQLVEGINVNCESWERQQVSECIIYIH